ncbi:MAG: LysR family transcriptional regulator [Polaromonas sp.]
MELRHLRYFLAVAQTGHITRAATQLGMQQPPLSQQIKALEKHLGMALFHRRPRGVTLTDGGRLFQVEAQRILQDVDAMKMRMERVAKGWLGQLHVGFTSSAAAHEFTPEALQACRKRYPEIELVLSEDNAAELTEGVASGRLHCGFLRVPVFRPEGLAFETLLREPVVVALSTGHALLKGRNKPRTLSINDLRDQALVLVRRPGAPGLYANLLTLCGEHGFQPRIAAEVTRMMTNLSLVAAGAGVSVVPASMLGAHPKSVVYCPLAESARLDAPLTLVYRTEDHAAGPMANFLALTRKIATRHRGENHFAQDLQEP